MNSRERVTAAWQDTHRTGHFDQTYRIVRPDARRDVHAQPIFPLRLQGGSMGVHGGYTMGLQTLPAL